MTTIFDGEPCSRPRPRCFDPGYDRVGKSRRQERRLAKDLGGRRQPGSGCFEGRKGDVKLDDFLIEAKRTDKHSLGLKVAWLKKIDAEAAAMMKTPAIAIEFGAMPNGVPAQWVLLPGSTFKNLVEAAPRGRDIG
jgi:hypothetical protein